MENLEERIRRRAHELWESEGRPNGRAEEHWAEAKRQVENEDRLGGSRDLGSAPHRPRTSDPLHVTGVQTIAKKA
jgi:hypothetical protein